MCGAGALWKTLVHSAQFCCESKTALKNSLKNKFDSSAPFNYICKRKEPKYPARNTVAQLCCMGDGRAAPVFCEMQPEEGTEMGGSTGPQSLTAPWEIYSVDFLLQLRRS